MGVKEIPKVTGDLRIQWDTEAPAYGNGGISAPGGGERDVEMGEDSHRGEREDDE